MKTRSWPVPCSISGLKRDLSVPWPVYIASIWSSGSTQGESKDRVSGHTPGQTPIRSPDPKKLKVNPESVPEEGDDDFEKSASRSLETEFDDAFSEPKQTLRSQSFDTYVSPPKTSKEEFYANTGFLPDFSLERVSC